jgi:DNA-binding NarL/FixJ family response regulator
VRVVVADDVLLVRTGVARLLEEVGHLVVGQAGDANTLVRLVATESPDVAVVDIRMPPTFTDEGLRAAERIRREYPGTGVVVLSQYVVRAYAEQLMSQPTGGTGYLLKERVVDPVVLGDAVRVVGEGGCVVDPDLAAAVMDEAREGSLLARLTPRERDVMVSMAQGRSNYAIADELGLSERSVESVIAQVFAKLDLPTSKGVNRRVAAVLRLLDP